MDSNEFMRKYNTLLQREKKAEAFLNDEKVDIAKRERWLPEYEKIVSELGKMIKEYKNMTGEDMPEEEILNGYSSKTRQN